MLSETYAPLPTINLEGISTNPARNAAILGSIREACENNGFFIITGHGISEKLQDEMFYHAKTFFAQPLTQKLAVDEGLSGNSHRGYQRIGGETNQPGKLPDLKEVRYPGSGKVSGPD